MKRIVCFSGGKDSTAMLITLLQNQEPIDDILYVDVGDWMWSNAEDHLQKVEKKLGVKITRLKVEDEIQNGFERYGFPSLFNRYCTGVKRIAMREYLKEKYLKESEVEGERERALSNVSATVPMKRNGQTRNSTPVSM